MASSSQPSSSNPVVTFFGTCPTCWEQLDSSQRDSCIAQTHLLRLVEGHYAWIATGELAKQWNENGYQEYSAVIEHGRYRIGKPGLGRDRIASHELRLLSTSSNRESATPFVIVTSRNLRKAQETISRLQKHPRLCKFGFQYMARQGGLRLTAGEPPSTSNIPSVAQHSLCGARIAVYSHTGVSRGSNKNVSTIGGVFRIRQKYYALTAAHVFFENIASTGSWADSGLYVTTESSVGGTQSAPQPEISGLYEILVEGLWPYAASADGRAQDPGRSLGLFEPQVAHRRKSPNPRASIEVIWNFESDWALIQLNGPDVCGANALQISPERMLDLKPPSQNLDPPDGTVLIAAGVSGQVLGNGLGTVGGVMLPWSSQETQAWSTETEIAVGDCGSVVIRPHDGMVYGFVVAHDAETMMTYFVPATKIFESIYRQCGLIDLPLQDFFGLEGSQVDARDRESDPSSKTGAPVRRFEQPASDSIFQMFMDKLRLHTTRNVDQQQYILTPSLEEWFLVKANPNASHLDLLLDFVYAQKIIVPVDADKVSDGSQKCLLVFSILLQIGHGDLIDKFQERGLIDSRLPFERAQVVDTIVQMGVQDAQEIAQQFSEKQWAYLPMIFQYGARLVCPPQMIVPIHQKQRINTKGGIATLWHIVVLEAFVDQALREVASNARYDDPSDHLGYRYQFALKSFKAGQQSLFDSERSAFRAFSNVEGTVRQLCDYIHGAEDSHGMYNIVLEYAELDLDEYFFSKDPPLLSTDIAIFWRRMFDIASAVANIHQFAKLRAGVVEAYSGVHGDIKPDNILWVQETFKLADPGFARFEKSGRAMGPPLGGTKTYGIPYGSPEQGNAGHTDTQASQAIDIWSLGCVLSMAATWVVLGSSGIQRFDQIRVKGRERALLETSGHLDDPNEKAALERGNSFHDDRKVLPEVREWHTNLRCFTRRSDDITASVLDLLDNSVLVAHPSSRINAKDLGALMVKAITTAVSKSRRNQQSTPMLQYGLPLPEASVDFMQDRSKAARKQIVSAPRHYDSVSTPKGDQRATSPSPRSSSSSSSITAEDFSSEPRPFGEHSSTIKVWPRPPVTSYPNPTAIHQEIITHHRHIDHGFERAPESPQRQPQLRGRSPLSVRDGDTGFSQKSSSRRQSTKRASLHQTVPQVLEEMSKSKKTGLSHLSVRGRAPRKDDILSRYIPNRVFSFLVDNAESMNEHWEEATTLLSALIYKTKGIDKDGVDLGFTTGSVQLHNCKTSKKLVEVMKTMGAMPRPGLHTDMNRSLAIILSSYLQRLKKTSSSTTLKDIERGFTLIVLTDGAWTDTQQQQDAIDRTILGFSRSLREIQGYSLVQRPVSIEFIRFGKDERANKSLKRLDFEPKDQDMCDIIDTTPANGNVWKMLLGSIMEEYDNQETDVEEATSISKRPLKISDASNRKSKWIPEEPETAPSSAVRPF